MLLVDGGAFVCWLEKTTGGGEVRLRRVRPDGKADSAIIVSATGAARSNGFPQMIRSGREIVFAWTGARVLTATLPFTD
jgi:hypothetical protein